MDNGLYAAPLEGLTGFVWRIAHDKVFGGADKYFAPFISPRATEKLTARELRDLTKGEDRLVPQILANNSEHFMWGVHSLAELGYKEINFNCGCPSGTVVAKGKGSGALRDPEILDHMLDGIFDALAQENMDIRISVKTRTGYDSAECWPKILEIYRKYPVSELIIHPRLGRQQYKGEADREMFLETLRGIDDMACSGSGVIVCNGDVTRSLNSGNIIYNGDVAGADDPAYGYGCGVMAGRGLISDPAMFRQVRGGAPATREELAEFHKLVLDGYLGYMPGPTPTLHRMKEFWIYYSSRFEVPDKLYKKMLKSKKLDDFVHYSGEILSNCNLK